MPVADEAACGFSPEYFPLQKRVKKKPGKRVAVSTWHVQTKGHSATVKLIPSSVHEFNVIVQELKDRRLKLAVREHARSFCPGQDSVVRDVRGYFVGGAVINVARL